MESFLSSCAAYGAFFLCVIYAVQGCVDSSGNCEQTQVNAAALQSIPCAVAADCPDLGLECVVPECVGADSAEGGVCRYHNAAVPDGLPPAIYEATYACRAWCAKGTAGSGQGGSGGQGGGAGGVLPAACAADSDCVSATTCQTGSCAQQQCVFANRSNGLACDENGGRLCLDGACVFGCVSDNECNDECPDTADSCLDWKCYAAPVGVASSCACVADGQACAIGSEVGVCWNKKCACNGDEDCDDKDPTTSDTCVLHVCAFDLIP